MNGDKAWENNYKEWSTKNKPKAKQQKSEDNVALDKLHKENKQLKNNLSVYKNYYNNTLKHNKELIEQVQVLKERLIDRDSAISTGIHVSNLMKKQNKRYREVFDELRNFVLRGENECNIKQLIMKRCNELEESE